MKDSGTMEDTLYVLGLWLLGLGSIGIIIYIYVLVPILPKGFCFFWKVLGIYCPGCGGTRAVEALLHGHILMSLWYHPLVLYTIIVFGGFMLTQTLERLRILKIKGWKFHEWYLYGALVIVFLNWILKNVLLLGFHITL